MRIRIARIIRDGHDDQHVSAAAAAGAVYAGRARHPLFMGHGDSLTPPFVLGEHLGMRLAAQGVIQQNALALRCRRISKCIFPRSASERCLRLARNQNSYR